MTTSSKLRWLASKRSQSITRQEELVLLQMGPRARGACASVARYYKVWWVTK